MGIVDRTAGANAGWLARDKNDASGRASASLGEMPEWNLADLYEGPASEVLADDFAGLKKRIAAFEKFRGKVAALSGDEFGMAIAEYERLDELLGKIASYAELYQSVDVSDAERGRFFQDTIERLTELSGQLLFFRLEINRLDEAKLSEKMRDKAAAVYAPWIRDLRASRKHELTDDLERLFLDKSTTGRKAWVRLFDETLAEMRCDVDGEALTLTQAFNLLTDPKEGRRRVAAKSIGSALGEKASFFTLVFNVLAKDKSVEDHWRKFPRPVSSRNIANLVEDDVVEALVSAVKDSYASTSHRYYGLKAKWFGKDKLDYWDRNAPLPDAEHRDIPWEEARKTVRDAYAGFSPRLADIVSDFFEKNWID
ncbi:MAG: oligoendopeptidase F, partial [Rhodospirillaceae bacterium]